MQNSPISKVTATVQDSVFRKTIAILVSFFLIGGLGALCALAIFSFAFFIKDGSLEILSKSTSTHLDKSLALISLIIGFSSGAAIGSKLWEVTMKRTGFVSQDFVYRWFGSGLKSKDKR